MLEYKPNMVLSNEEFDSIGSTPVRHDGADKVTGRAIYGADVQMAGLIHGKILRSPHAHAVIKSIDTSAAEAMPGVVAVVTAADLPELTRKSAKIGEGDDYNMDHTATTFLIDETGELAGTLAYGENPDTALAKLERLVGV